MILDKRRTSPSKFTAFRSHCLRAKLPKSWVGIEEGNPPFSGLFFIKHVDFVGDIDIAEYFINKKGNGFWMTPGNPKAWSEIETYDYKDKEGNLIYDE